MQLKDILKEQRRGKVTKVFLFLHDSASALRALHPDVTDLPGLPVSWSPTLFSDMASSDYHLFPGLKKKLKVRHFSFVAEAISAAEIWLVGQTSKFFFCVACEKLEQRAKNCIEHRGEYVE